ncbi:hypothetical protein Pfo_010085 [Paulownia fortunei]|nr:hypothetical protein Pfo_010085 [Paulownia fortunei]
MAFKKRKSTASASTSVSSTFDKHKFLNITTHWHYLNHTIKCNLTQERGINTTLAPTPQIIERKRWQEFTQQPIDVVVPLSCRVFVQGKRVHFDHSTINAFYGLPDIDDDEYSTYKSNEVTFDEIISTLAYPGAQWTIKDETVITFSSTHLYGVYKVWHSFIGAKLMPTTHLSDLTKERAILLFAIITGKSINIGRTVGVPWRPDEELLLPKTIISNAIAESYTTRPTIDTTAPS